MKNPDKQPQEVPDLPQLRNKIVSTFNQEELNDLCFELSINPEEIPTGTLSSRARELVTLFYRRQDLITLLELLTKLRPKVDWMNLISTTQSFDGEVSSSNYVNRYIPQIETEVRNIIDICSLPVVLKRMVNYHFGFISEIGAISPSGSSKYIRGIITLLACEACGENMIRALPAAAAIEIAHHSTLVHDDIEDNSNMRRGKPSMWAMWGMPQALNAGTAMLFLSQKAMSRAIEFDVPIEKISEAKDVLNDSLLSISQGQFLDMSFETRGITPEEYLQMIEFKTADLLKASGVIGAILANADRKTINALGNFGKWLGIAFQLSNDVEGIWGKSVETDPKRSDLYYGKRSAPVVFASQKNPRIWDAYSTDNPTVDYVNRIKAMIEDAGGKKIVEDTVQASTKKVFESLKLIDKNTEAGNALHSLAKRLLNIP